MIRLDPELAAVAELYPPSDLRDVAAAREANRKRHAADPEFAGRDRIEVDDDAIAGTGGPIPVRLYRPRDAGAALPAVLWLHGGAFCLGDLDSSDRLCMRMCAAAGALVVNVDYRLAPENPCPAGLDDAHAALDWLSANASALGVDASRIAVAGASAGGCLAAGVVLRARDAAGPPVAHLLLVQPVLDDRCATASAQQVRTAPVLDAASTAAMWQIYLAGATPDGYTAPARNESLTGLPPAFVLVAQVDPLRDEAIDYAMRLSAADVAVDLHVVAGAFHGFDSVVPYAAISRRATGEYLAALKRALSGDGRVR